MEQYPKPNKPTILMLSRNSFAIHQTKMLHKVLLDSTYKRNLSAYTLFAQLQRLWGRVDIVCGDLCIPVSYKITVKHDDISTSFNMYSSGAYSCPVEEHHSDDFKTCHQMIPIPHLYHLQPVHSYLQFVSNKPHRIILDMDPMHSTSVLMKYLINGIF